MGRVTYRDMSSYWPKSENPHARRARPGNDRLGRQPVGRRAGLVDEYRLLVQPLILGRGQPLFDQLPELRHLDLIDTTPFPSGIVVYIYRPKRA